MVPKGTLDYIFLDDLQPRGTDNATQMADSKKGKTKSLLKLQLDMERAKAGLHVAAEKDGMQPNAWAKRTLGFVAEYRIAGLSMEQAYTLALKEIRRDDPALADKIRAAVDKAADKAGAEARSKK
jgi:hypothetical protein